MTTDYSGAPGQGRDILSVSHLNRLSRQLLETHLPLVWVEGEISNLSRPSSGHWYFTLKDDTAQVRCAMFRGRNQTVKFSPTQGQQVLLRARVSIYEGRGDYQLVAEHMEEAGLGALQRAFEALKNKLAAEGLFATERKKALPERPEHIAIITSPTGAAIRDVLSVIQRRYPAQKVTVIPVAVQGEQAAPAIVSALQLAVQAELFDLLILTRGGGSIEDLWAFNDEALARAISACPLPVISAVGHEVDFTIADFAADLRAPTPSAAAEIAVPDVREQLAGLQERERQLARSLDRLIRREKTRLEALSRRLRHPGEKLRHQAQQLDQLELRLRSTMRWQLERQERRLRELSVRQQHQHPQALVTRAEQLLQRSHKSLRRSMEQCLVRHRQLLHEKARVLDSVSPLATLDRGFSVVRNQEGAVITAANQVAAGEDISAHLAKGQLTCRVIATAE